MDKSSITINPIQNQELYRLLVDAVNDYAIFALDTNGNILTWNAGARRLKGYEATEVIGTHFSRFYTKADIDRDHPQHELELALKNGSYEEEGWRVKKDGSKFWANVVITALIDAEGNHRGFAKVTRDLTSRKASEDKLKESEERFRLLVTNVQNYAIITLDPEGYIKTWNIGAQRIKGYSPNEIIGKHFSQFYTPQDIKDGKPALELKTAQTEGRYEEEGWRVKKDGSKFWANVIVTPMRDDKGILRGFAKVTRDLTERKIAADELQKAYESLEKRVEERTTQLLIAKEEAENAVKTRDEFLSIASHELKTPLTSLKLQIQMRKRHIDSGKIMTYSEEKIREIVNDEDKQINRIGRLIDDMLDITHITSGKLTLEFNETDLGKLVSDVLKRFAPQFEEKHLQVTSKVSDNIIGLWDRYRIEQVFINLLTNAMKYGESKPIEVTVKQDDAKAVLVVRDHGLGISPSDHARVFQQFERAVPASSISGLGLGLFIVKQIIESHYGNIHVESELGHGSSFIVELPLSSKL